MTTSPASFDKEALDELVVRNLAVLRDRIDRSGRNPADVRIVAVTKGFSVDYVEAAQRAGLGTVGENYVGELVAKRAVGPTGLTWHFLGALQTNKIALICQHAELLAGVARVKEIDVISRQPVQPSIYLQIDYTGAPGRNGVDPSGIGDLLTSARELGVNVRGLMTVAAPDPEGARRAFGALARAADEFALAERSMGMSDDLELACALGSSEIRVGRALFGPRPRADD